MFPISLIAKINQRADKDGISPASLVRKATEEYVDQPNIMGDHGSGYEAGVRSALFFLKEEAVMPRFPSGKTLGDSLADKVLERLGMKYIARAWDEKGEGD
jgi:hypothetical protein